MTILNIERTYNSNCTTGIVTFGDFKCSSLELPWINNKQNVSCIPWGIYQCRKITSPSLGECFEIMNVSDRTYIRGHVANHTRQIKGCVAIGETLTDFDNDGVTDVTNSNKTFTKLMSLLPHTFYIRLSL